MAEFTCPACQKIVKNLAKHTKRMHPEPAKPAEPAEPAEPATELELDLSGVDKPGEGDNKYHCVDCGHSGVSYRAANCPKCGRSLDWGEL